MKRFLSTLFLIVVFISLFGQNTQKNEFLYKRAARDVQLHKAGETVTYVLNEIEGTPYLNEDFLESKVVLQNGDVMSSVILNYNIFTDSFEFMKEGVSYILTNNYVIGKIHFDNKVFVYMKYLDLKDQFKYGYAEQLIEGNCELYKKYQIEFHEPEPAETQFNEPKSARFSQIDPNFLLYFTNKDKTVRINTYNKKKFSAFFGNQKNDIYSYIRENKLKISDENDLKEVVKYYNSL